MNYIFNVQKIFQSRVLLGFTLAVATLASGVSFALAAHQADNGEFVYGAELTGSEEVPAVDSDTAGDIEIRVTEDMDAAAFAVQLDDGEAITAAHLHCGVAGTNGPVIAFLFGNIPGGFDVDGTLTAFTLTEENIVDADCPTPIDDIESLASAMGAGEVYVNVHSVANPSGEVRGQLAPIPQDEDESGPDADNDGFISVLEGVPFYGGIVYSLTTSGDVSAGSALALDRFPTSDRHGRYTYSRTFELEEGASDPDTFHVVVHGIDLNDNGEYDGEKESSIAEGVPFEATVPAACGVVEMRGNSSVFLADINELNSTGVNGHMIVKKRGNEVTVRMHVRDTSANIAHAQHFHMGGAGVCPPNTNGVTSS